MQNFSEKRVKRRCQWKFLRFLNFKNCFKSLNFLSMDCQWCGYKFPLTEMVMPSNKASSDAGPELAGRAAMRRWKVRRPWCAPLEKGVRGIEISKSSRRQPCCCCQWHLSSIFRSVWCTWTLRNSDYPWEPRNSTRAMRLLGFTSFGESAWMFSFLHCEAVWLATMNLLL